jgi:hypothetical protein
MSGYTITTPCELCDRWLPPRHVNTCVDCERQICYRCALVTGHRLVHEDAEPELREVMPEGWHYLRCRDTPYSISDALDAAYGPAAEEART